MKAKQPDMNEMLNAYMDGELEARQAVEFKRLLENTPDLKARLAQLQNLKGLLSNLPQEGAPEEMADQVRSILERKTLFGEAGSDQQAFRRTGSIIFQKIRAVAAVLALGAVLSFLVYSIVSPVDPGSQKVADLDTSADGPMRGRLELACTALDTVDNFLMRSVQFNNLNAFVTKEDLAGQRMYHVSCRRQEIQPLLSDLSSVWHQFQSPVLIINTDKMDETIRIEKASLAQVASLVNEPDSQKRLEYAKLESIRNNMQDATDSERAFAVASRDSGVAMPPRPMLTSSEPNKDQQSESRATQEDQVELIIVLKKNDL